MIDMYILGTLGIACIASGWAGIRYGRYRGVDRHRRFSDSMYRRTKTARMKAEISEARAQHIQEQDMIEIALNRGGIPTPDECPRSVLACVRDHHERANKYIEMARVEAFLRRVLEDIGWDEGFCFKLEVENYLVSCGVTLEMQLKSVKQIRPFVREIRGEGYKRADVLECPDSQTIIWIYERPGESKYLRVRIAGVFPGDEGATCRYVQVGVKTVEQPVYELVCDDENDGDEA